MKEKEYYCYGCGKEIKESILTNVKLRCPFCSCLYFDNISKKATEVDWVTKIIRPEGIFTKERKCKIH